MSWYGSHPIFTHKQIRSVLPKAACKCCVYFFRVFAARQSSYKFNPDHRTECCGINWHHWIQHFMTLEPFRETQAEFNAHKLSPAEKNDTTENDPSHYDHKLERYFLNPRWLESEFGQTPHIKDLVEHLASHDVETYANAMAHFLANATDMVLVLARVCHVAGSLETRATRILRSVDKPAIDRLAVILQRRDDPDLSAACRALKIIENPAAKSILVNALESPYDNVRKEASRALGYYSGPEVVEGLSRLLLHPRVEVAINAAQLLRWNCDSRAEGSLILAINRGNLQLTGEAIEALGHIGNRNTLPIIRQYELHPNRSLRQSARYALSQFYYLRKEIMTTPGYQSCQRLYDKLYERFGSAIILDGISRNTDAFGWKLASNPRYCFSISTFAGELPDDTFDLEVFISDPSPDSTDNGDIVFGLESPPLGINEVCDIVKRFELGELP